MSVQTMDVTSQHLSMSIYVCLWYITSKHTEVRKFQALKRYGTQISLDMTLEIRPQVKGASRYELEIFREGVKLFNSWVCQVSWRSADPFVSYSRKTQRGFESTSPPPLCRRGLKSAETLQPGRVGLCLRAESNMNWISLGLTGGSFNLLRAFSSGLRQLEEPSMPARLKLNSKMKQRTGNKFCVEHKKTA